MINSRIFDTLDKLEEFLSPNRTKNVDRNRTKVMPSVKTFYEWKTLIIDRGFKIEKSICVYPNSNIIDIWNIGVRPISHLLIQLIEDINLDKRRRIKDEWNEIFFEILKPFLILKKYSN